MNEQNIEFLRDRNVDDNIIETFLDTVILGDEKFLAIYCIQKGDKIFSDFKDKVLLLTDKRIINLDIDNKSINFTSYSLKLIKGFKMVKTYTTTEKSIRNVEFIEKIIIFLKTKIEDKDYLEIEFDEKNTRLSSREQKRIAFEFIKSLTEILSIK